MTDVSGVGIETEDIGYYIKFLDGLNRLDFKFNNPKYDVVERFIDNTNTRFVELSEVVYFFSPLLDFVMNPY